MITDSLIKQATANLKAGQRRFREQTGTVVERKGAFWLRFYRDGEKGARIKVTERLCEKDAAHSTIDCNALKVLQRSRMAEVNAEHHASLQKQTPAPEAPPLTIGKFWKDTYEPWAEANLRWSTHHGYVNIWNQYLKNELETKSIASYTTIDASEYLDRLAKRLNTNSLAHIRSLMSGIFKRAINTKGPNGKALIDRNPIHDVEVSVRQRKPKPRVKYTPEETVTMLNAIPELKAKLFFGLTAVMGMRPEETAACKWENLEGDVYHVREAAPYGVLGELKTERSKRDLVVIEPVKTLMREYHTQCGKPATGLLFTNGDLSPVNHNYYVRRWIKPHAEKVCSRWNGLYSGRHGAATTLYNLTGDMRAAFQVLGNSFEVVSKTYVESDASQGKIGLAMVEERLKAVTKEQQQ